MKKVENKKGFTLVELIVVLVILAILATLLIPILTGYIDKSKKQAVITEASDVWKASQAALSECYALYPESFNASCKFTTTINGQKLTNLGRITNGALGDLQAHPNSKTEEGTSSRIIARQVLNYLDSSTRNSARYTITYYSDRNAWNTTPSQYFAGKKVASNEILIQIFHTNTGKIKAINFGKNGYMVTMTDDGKTTCEKDGKTLPSTN